MIKFFKWLKSLFSNTKSDSKNDSQVNDENELDGKEIETNTVNAFTTMNQSTAPTCADTICLTVVNDDTQTTIIYQDKSTSLDVTLENSTGSDLTLTKGDSAPQFEVLLPQYFTDEEIKNMAIDLSDWKFKYDAGALLLTYDGSGTEWKTGSFNAIKFQITSVKASASPTGGTFQINFHNFSGSPHIPLQQGSPLTLDKQPKPGNANLAEVLEVSLDNLGKVYVSSDKKDALQNTLFLNIKNTGKDPLYKAAKGETDWPVTPQVTVNFIYGNTSGALAPNDDPNSPQIGSAWNISAQVSISDGNSWNTANPDKLKDNPLWYLNPIKNTIEKQRLDIIGTDENANITFSFSEIVSLTPIGHTNMTISFANFYKDKDTPYDTYTIVLDISKIVPPATRGIIDFFSPNPNLEIKNLQDPVLAHFRWSLFQVHKTIISNLEYPAKIPPVTKIYSADNPLQYVEDHEVTLSDFDTTQNLTFNLESFDGNDTPLNSKQFIIHLKSNFFVDPRDGQAYPTVVINGKVWMAHNMNFDTKGGNVPYSGFNVNREKYGYLYNWEAAKAATPDGWHLPLRSEWEDLVSFLGGSKPAYAALIDGGSTGFNAMLGGWGKHKSNGQIDYQDLGPTGIGYYWSNSPGGSGQAYFTKFINQLPNSSTVYKDITTGNLFTTDNFFSCRYVKN